MKTILFIKKIFYIKGKLLLNIILIFMTVFYILIIDKTNSKDLQKQICTSNETTDRKYQFMKDNNISYYELSKYLKFSTFDISLYYEYENARTLYNFTYLQALNFVNYPNYYTPYQNSKYSLFTNSTLILTNKSFYLSKYYVPSNLVSLNNYKIQYIIRPNENMKARKIVLDNFSLMYEKAKSEGIELIIYSAYRSFEKQEDLYYNINNCNDQYSAKPGYSEHQTGYCLDISDSFHGLSLNLAYSNTYKWLIENSYKYGFILRYPKGKEEYTKYNYEPWHFRYVGVKDSYIITNNNLCLEEYLFNNFELK